MRSEPYYEVENMLEYNITLTRIYGLEYYNAIVTFDGHVLLNTQRMSESAIKRAVAECILNNA